MPFFDNDFQLLSSAQQTFLATIATLVVLCSYKNNSNFLSSLTTIFKDVFHKDIKHKIEWFANSFELSFLDECNIYSHSSVVSEEDRESLIAIQLEADTIRNEFFIKASEDKIKKSQASFDNQTKLNDEKQFPLLIAFYTFVISVAVLTVDSLNFNRIFGVFVLFLFDFAFLIMTISGWVEYWSDKAFLLHKLKNVDYFWGIATLLVLVLLLCEVPLLVKIFLLIFAVLFYAAFVYCIILKKCQGDNYNIRVTAKYVVKRIINAAFIALIVYAAFQYDFLYKMAPEELQKRFDIIMDNLSFVLDGLFVWRMMFVILCVLNAFILPLFLKYCYDRKNWETIKETIEQDFDGFHQKRDELKSRYNKLKEKIGSGKVS